MEKKKLKKNSTTYTTGNQAYDIACFNDHAGTSDASSTDNQTDTMLSEAKRYIRRYYIRPQNIFCSNKYEILRALLAISDNKQNCTIYTLNNLGDNKDVHRLTNNDIIYYYDDNILYDKNHVKVIDYDLKIKHEEDRDKVETNAISTATFNKIYDDRLTTETDLSEDINPLNLDFPRLTEEADDTICCICGEELNGYGNNAAPYADGRCCDACNLKFVIPARIAKMQGNNEED